MEIFGYAQMFDYLSDFFENVKWSRPTLIEVGNTLIESIALESDTDHNKQTVHMYDSREVLEAKLRALYILVQNHHEIENALDYSTIIPCISSYDEECTEMGLYLLACTGDLKYMELIEKEAARFESISAEEYTDELKARADRT